MRASLYIAVVWLAMFRIAWVTPEEPSTSSAPSQGASMGAATRGKGKLRNRAPIRASADDTDDDDDELGAPDDDPDDAFVLAPPPGVGLDGARPAPALTQPTPVVSRDVVFLLDRPPRA